MSITRLPTELVVAICRDLELLDWIALRTTCSALYAKSTNAFADRYCRSIGILITSHSLCRLEELAAHEIFRARVQDIWIVPSLFEGLYDMDQKSFELAVASPRCWISSAKLNAQYVAYQAQVADHLSIVESDLLSKVFEKCFKRFENLNSLRILHDSDDFVWESLGNADFRCLGWSATKHQLGFNPLDLNVRKSRSNKLKTRAKDHAVAFSALLGAAVTTNRKLKKLETCNGNHCALPPSEITINHTQDTLFSLIEGLESLHICVCIWDAQPDDTMFKRLIHMPVMVAPTLTELTFSQWTRTGQLDPHYFHDLSHRIKFARLENLHLYWIEMTPGTFKAFLRTARPTLKTLSLESVNLQEEPPKDLSLEHEPASWDSATQEKSNAAWRQVWTFLGDDFSLRYLSLRHIGYRGYRLQIEDQLSDVSGSFERSGGTIAGFDAEHARVPFREWVSRLRSHPPRSPRGRISILPGKDYGEQMV